ncbi:MAG: TatD family hydrolase [Caldicoprobacterales bacterium]|jgi:TatD DNase family protein|nr:TatD family hydrolase [Clostridia bacterium]MDI9512651.1 TatD family hydrolase [Bacillota bacterium]NLH57911.1 TatD family hydrolase [Clostridiales bacterium]
MFFDSHAHLDDERFDEDRDEVIRGLPDKGIAYVLNAGADMDSSQKSIDLAKSYDFIYAAVGVHPHDADSLADAQLKALEQMAKEEKVKAIGEIGLDYHYDFSPREQQKEAFALQLDLAFRLNLPVIIHNREAHKDTLDILRAHRSILKGGVMHSYSGSWEMAKELMDLGFYISLAGIVTFKNAKKPVELAEKLPMDRLLIETDCPYLTPHPFRGKRNDPGFVRLVAEKIGQLRGMDTDLVAQITKNNACSLFRI